MIPTALLFDLDNTLSESKTPMKKSMALLLTKLLQKVPVAVISGGKIQQLQLQVANELPPHADLSNLYLFPTCGAALFRHIDGEWTRAYEESLSQEEIDEIEDVLEEAVIESGFIDSSVPSAGERVEARVTQVTLSALGQQATTAAKQAWDPTGVKRRDLTIYLSERLPNFTVATGGYTSFDVTRKGIDKAYGVHQFALELGVDVDSMLYVGDALQPGGNDAIVIPTGVKTQSVNDPSDTEIVIQQVLDDVYASTSRTAPTTHTNTSPMTTSLRDTLASTLSGDVTDADIERAKFSHDTSLFTRTPSLVVYPKNAEDVSKMVRAVRDAKQRGENVSVTGRSAGTDMSGGPLTTSVVAVFMKYMNKVIEVTEDAAQQVQTLPNIQTHGYAVAEPGVFYRDFEKETLAHHNLVLPSYPASRELCAIGGIINNNSGGERTLEYGKTEDYIDEVEMVLSDGSVATFKELSKEELSAKKQQKDLEGEIYRKMEKLVTDNATIIQNAKPKVSKNSAGYNLWDIANEKSGTFNLAKLICGAQGTLGLMTKAKLRLVKEETHRAMLVIFLKDLAVLPEIVRRVLPHNPESFESYDDQTFKLAVKFMPQMLSQMGLERATRLGISFLPELGMVASGGVPKLVLMAEFSADSAEEALKRATEAEESVADLHLPTSIKKNEHESEKYWIVRRESFALLRKNVHGLYASPFIDDFVVPPDTYPQFLPELNALLEEYSKFFIYTIAGHIGNGNFHIIPLMDLTKPEVRQVVIDLAPKVYALVIKYGGTTTGEHNDGIIRTPYLPMQFGDKVVALFKETKDIFDPLNIFNPGKKVGGTFEDIERDMLRTV